MGENFLEISARGNRVVVEAIIYSGRDLLVDLLCRTLATTQSRQVVVWMEGKVSQTSRLGTAYHNTQES